MARLSIRVLGPFQVSFDGEPVSGFASDKVRALLVYLALSPDHPHRRETLAGLLWPEFPERSARTNLRNALANLRHVLGDGAASPPFLLSSHQTIQFDRESDYWLDVDAFEGLTRMTPPSSERLEQAVSLVRGPFLEGFSLADAAPFEEWQLLRREQFGRQMAEALDRLTTIYERRGAYEQALTHARRRVELEPWQEEGQRLLMRLLARSGHRSEALAQYDRLRRSLKHELGAEPLEETRALHQAILSGELAPEPAPRPGSPAPTWHLPASPTPFFGRRHELAALEAMLANPATRLVTLTGPGGSGKTRLALEAGARFAQRDRQALADKSPLAFPHGAVFVPLAAADSVEGLVAALADALKLRLQAGQEQLLEALRRKEILLILDNLEHLLTGVGFLAEILRTAPGVQILATSREQLQLRGEHVLSVGGLSYPDHGIGPSSPEAADVDACVTAYPAFQLLVESARRVQPHFTLAVEELPVLTDICRQVDSLPLALELAASWADALSLSDILAEARKSLGFLQAEWRATPRRQRSIRAAFDVSWRRLDQAERAAFSQLSVFRGGFGREAATQVVKGTAAAPRLLATLVRKSFLQHDPATLRYHVHELLRQYGSEKLAADPALETATRNEHSRYYCDWLSRQEAGIKGAEQQALWDAIQRDIENVQAACMWAATQGRLRQLEQAINTLGLFYWRGYGNSQQGELTFRRLGDALAADEDWSSPATAGAQRTMARILMWQCSFNGLLGDDQKCGLLAQRSLGLLDTPPLAGQDTRSERAHIALQLGYVEYFSDATLAKQHFARSHDLCRELSDQWGMAYALLGLGRAARNLGQLAEAKDALTQSLSLHREIGNQIGESETMATLGQLAYRQSRFQEGEDLIQQSLSLMPETNRYGIAFGLGLLGWAKMLTGRFHEAVTSAAESLALFGDLGLPVRVVKLSVILADAHLHAGNYGAARIQAEAAVSLAREADYDWGVGYGKRLLGEVALVEAAFAQAYQALQESLFTLKEATDDTWNLDQSAWLGLAARGLEHNHEAWQHLVSALERTSQGQQFTPLMVALAGIALLLADEGHTERGLELYALASRYPFVAHSRWFEDVAGSQVTALAANVPEAAVTAARQRGQARDLEATVEELLTELCG